MLGSSRAACFQLFAACLVALTCSGLSSPVRADDAPKVQWQPQWRRVNLFEGLALIPVGGLLLVIETQWKPADQPRWRGGILYDELSRDVFRGRTPELQRTAGKVSDWMFIGGVLAPVIVDAGIVALGVHRNPDVALQIFLIDVQSLMLAGLFSLSAEHGVGRARPYVSECDADGVVRDTSGRTFRRCSPGSDTKSFYSGHAAATAAIAGLTCIHHQHMPLYGGGIADLIPCLFTIGVSISTGIGRIIADKHWTSDVFIGWSIGALSGYLLPALIHYGFSDRPDGRTAWTQSLRIAPLPQVFAGGIGLGVVGDM